MQYPHDIYTLVRQKTFSIEAHFVPLLDESPMKIFEKTFSRFVFTVLSDGTAGSFNVHLEDLPGMRMKTNIAMQSILMNTSAVQRGDSPAFTKRFMAGNLKGKTPIDVLLENPEKGKELLNNQYKYLAANLQKFPKNQDLMDAIADAAKQDLSKCTKAAPPMTILDIGVRPLIRKARKDGLCQCYEGSVIATPGNRYPVCVTVKNYYAPVIKQEGGKLNVNLSGKDKESEKTKTFNMTAEEWIAAIDEMESAKNCFRHMYFPNAYKLAEEAARAAREKSA